MFIDSFIHQSYFSTLCTMVILGTGIQEHMLSGVKCGLQFGGAIVSFNKEVSERGVSLLYIEGTEMICSQTVQGTCPLHCPFIHISLCFGRVKLHIILCSKVLLYSWNTHTHTFSLLYIFALEYQGLSAKIFLEFQLQYGHVSRAWI